MAPSKFKGALFDLDGTLADNYSAIHLCTCEVFKRHGIPAPTRQRIVSTVGGSILITMKRLLAGTQFADKYEQVASEYLDIYDKFVFCDLRAMPYSKEILKALKAAGIRLGCFTNKQEEAAEKVLERLGLREHLDCVVATTLHSPRKPDPRYTQMALRALGVEASDAVCIGDSPFDYKAADSCCVACALVSTGGDSRESLVENCPRAIGVYDDLRALAKGVFSVEI